MFRLIAAIVGAVALGCLIAYSVVLTVRWLKDRISQKLRNPMTDEVAVGDIKTLISQCTNKRTLSELEAMADQGYTNFVVGIDKDEDIVGEVELIQAKEHDYQVDQYIGKQGMVRVSY